MLPVTFFYAGATHIGITYEIALAAATFFKHNYTNKDAHEIAYSLFAVCLVATQLVACNKEIAAPYNPTPVTAGAIAGNFIISSFVTTGNQTAAFNGFAFTFNENGTIVAAKGSDTFTGTWKFDDTNNTEIKIGFPGAPLNQLNGSWHIEDLTGDHLSLTGSEAETEDHGDDHSAHHSSLEFERD